MKKINFTNKKLIAISQSDKTLKILSEELDVNEKTIRRHLKEYGLNKQQRSYKNENHPIWKGDKVGYTQLHKWIKQNKPKVHLCENCNKKPSLDLANISGKYKRDINDFEWLCRSCHMKKDGRIYNLKNNKDECDECD